MTDSQYFFLMLILILNGLSICLLAVSHYYHTQAVTILVNGVGQLIAEIRRTRTP